MTVDYNISLVDIVIAAEVWNLLKSHEYDKGEWMRVARPEYLLCAFHYLKQYTTESEMADKCGCHEDMLCKWTGVILVCIAVLEH